MIRVTAGTAKGLTLKVPDSARPTSEKIRAAILNSWQVRVPGGRFLDLFAGAGAIGCEALSRGASHCTFVDQNRKAIAIVRQNVASLHQSGVDGTADFIAQSAAASLMKLVEQEALFDCIWLDPPYASAVEDFRAIVDDVHRVATTDAVLGVECMYA